MFHFTRRRQPLVCLLALALLFCLAAPRRASMQTGNYTIVDVGSLGGNQSKGYGINSNGKVVGASLLNPNDFSTQPFFWNGSQSTNLGNFGGDGGEAYAVNDSNYVVGAADLPSGAMHPFIWSSGVGKTDIGAPGAEFAVAWDINNSNQVVGQTEVSPLVDRAFIWTAETGIQTLGTLPGGSSSTARGINETGQVVGESNTPGGQTHAFLYNGKMADLGTLGGNLSIAYEVNDAGKVVGYSRLNNNGINPPYHAFLYTANTGMNDLGAFGGAASVAFDINNQDQIVGYAEATPGVHHAFIYDAQNGMRDLNDVLQGSGWTLQEARSINNAGQITGFGLNPDGVLHAFLINPPPPTPTPTPTPQTYTISGQVTENGTGLSGVTMTLNGASAATVQTDGIGNYSFANLSAGNYIVTPSRVNYVFTPPQASFNALASNQTANFTGVSGGITPPVGLQFFPLAHPVRILDTRAGQTACDTPSAPLAAAASRTQLAQRTCDGLTIPSTAQAVVGNATVVNSTGAGAGFVTLYPTGADRPTVSNLNYVAGQIVPNAFTVALGPGTGSFEIYVPNSIHLIVDITGYYAPPTTGGLYYHPLPHPIRLLDTRAGQTACDTPGAQIQVGVARTEAARITCDGITIPAAAQAIVGNATVVNGSAEYGFITLYPSDAARPNSSNLNYAPGQIVPNAFTVGLGATDGAFNIYAGTTTNFIADVAGYYSASAAMDSNGVVGLLYYPLSTPARLLDTRPGQTACDAPGTTIAGNTARTEAARVTCGGVTIPAAAQAIVGNATVVNSSADYGFITLYPSGATRPTVSNLNYAPGQIVPNAFVVALGASDGAFNIYAGTTTHFIADVTGYFAP